MLTGEGGGKSAMNLWIASDPVAVSETTKGLVYILMAHKICITLLHATYRVTFICVRVKLCYLIM